MTRIYSVTYAEHLSFQPEPVDQPSKGDPNGKLTQPAVDSWRTGSKIVAVVDGWAEDAITKAKALIAESDDVKEKRVIEVAIVAVSLQNEAE